MGTNYGFSALDRPAMVRVAVEELLHRSNFVFEDPKNVSTSDLTPPTPTDQLPAKGDFQEQDFHDLGPRSMVQECG